MKLINLISTLFVLFSYNTSCYASLNLLGNRSAQSSTMDDIHSAKNHLDHIKTDELHSLCGKIKPIAPYLLNDSDPSAYMKDHFSNYTHRMYVNNNARIHNINGFMPAASCVQRSQVEINTYLFGARTHSYPSESFQLDIRNAIKLERLNKIHPGLRSKSKFELPTINYEIKDTRPYYPVRKPSNPK